MPLARGCNASDILSLVLDVTREGTPDQHALATYSLMHSGDRNAARLHLAKAGSYADEVIWEYPQNP